MALFDQFGSANQVNAGENTKTDKEYGEIDRCILYKIKK